MPGKKFKLLAEEIIQLITSMGGCLATDKITVDGFKVGFMYRKDPFDEIDSGWRFFSGHEDQDYIDTPDNSMIYDVNTIANYDKAIIPYLNLFIGTELERLENTNEFQIVPG